ncbi:hypothetical protein F5Y04DRAFT_273680 [Hypomontagnella monticulosa]|nr:hypothetical protein F5Y04DRAFT_273680 [Hypomontagnella monticulosa]
MASSSHNSSSDVNEEDRMRIRNQQRFAEFGPRALLFARSILWSDAELKDISIEMIQGGECNHIFGLTRKENASTGSREVQYILRVPIFHDARVDRDVAALQFVKRYTQILAPEAILFDHTTQNGLKCPFQIQSRLEGTNFHTAFPNLDHATRSKIAHELGGIFRQMLAARSHVAGLLTFPPRDHDLCATLYTTRFDPDEHQLIPLDPAVTETVPELFTTNFQRQKYYDLDINPDNSRIPRFMDQFCDMVADLDGKGYFKDVWYCLAHLDFSSYNVLVHQTNDPTKPVVSGIVDWDSAILAPTFAACKPPFWVWRGIENELEDERFDHNEPLTLEESQLKDIFDAAAGPEYRRFAYEPMYRLARRLMNFVLDARMEGEDFIEANIMLSEWRTIR